VTAVLILLWANLTSPEPPVAPALHHTYSAGDSQFVRVMGNLLGPPMVDGNRVTGLLNGDQVFPAMLAAIRSARRSVNFETYIYWSGRVGRAFADAMSERARAGVPTHLLIDWVGSWSKTDRHILQEMRDAGVEIVLYRPLRWYSIDRLNNRTHRKLLIVRLNDEANLNVVDAGFGQEEARAFEDDRRRSRQVTLEAWRHRPLWERIQERWATVFRSQL
jgi:cardiolipin synthase